MTDEKPEIDARDAALKKITEELDFRKRARSNLVALADDDLRVIAAALKAWKSV